ncbi:PqiC family protein [Sphingomonas nostoxanthinifaciens]|uniref:PqiC family protein n=1 Tax=Sphingomonas nostoxanthinifaciens TaxID=2872652 RepID=UPI001CC2150A|nr:ABC-type transport auxiliary lipoprotein family protein [Sphingomonas nostoxanthinifaciens]UAK24285.1 PqiC family protein [Sphingomonas nostoxanthinifaciens]
MRQWLPAPIAALALAACAHSPATTMLTLDAVAPAAAAPAYRGAPIAIPAVHIPAALDRAEYTRQVAGAEMKVDDFARWIAPLGTLARDTLVRDLTARLPEGAVLPPGAVAAPPARTVSVTILAFGIAGGQARMDVAYRELPSGPVAQLSLETPQQAGTPTASAEAFSQLLAQLADRMAASLGRP